MAGTGVLSAIAISQQLGLERWTLRSLNGDNARMKTVAVSVVVVLIAATAATASAKITDPTCNGILYGIAVNGENQTVSGIRVMLWPIGVDLGYVLPTTKTTEAGEYSFEHVCAGRFSVVVDDELAGYPPSFWSYFLDNAPEVELTAEHLQVELPVIVPEKAASITIVARDARTNATIRVLEITLRASKASSITVEHDSSEPLLLPANTDLLCRLVADGYREWPDGKKGAKHFRLAPADRMSIKVDLEPLR
jgi:hypothetical protein